MSPAPPFDAHSPASADNHDLCRDTGDGYSYIVSTKPKDSTVVRAIKTAIGDETFMPQGNFEFIGFQGSSVVPLDPGDPNSASNDPTAVAAARNRGKSLVRWANNPDGGNAVRVYWQGILRYERNLDAGGQFWSS